MIRVENKRTYRGAGVYIGRPSLLGNPFEMNKERTEAESEMLGGRFPAGRIRTREEAVEEFRIWLWMKIQERGEVYAELTRLAESARRGDLTLLCWCAPKPCHGDIVKRAIEWARSINR